MKENENIQTINNFDQVTEVDDNNNTDSNRIAIRNEHVQRSDNLFDINKIDTIKKEIKLNINIMYEEFQFAFINQILSFYKIINNEYVENIDKNLIEPYFNNELFDENYIENNFPFENIKNSILFKKNVLNMDNLIHLRYQQNHPHNAANQIEIDQINENIRHRNYQFIGMYGLNCIFTIIFILLSLLSIIMLYLLRIDKEKNIIKKINKNFWIPFIYTFYSNEYKCLSLDYNDLINNNYSFNISCNENTHFYYISKFGISPLNEEGQNIAQCYSESFKNLINIDNDCDLTEFLDNKLEQYKYTDNNINININKMNISNQILNNCINKYNKNKFFLSYSCYIPYIKRGDSNIKRKDFIKYLLISDCFIIYICYRFTFTNISKYFRMIKKNKIDLKNLTLMIDNIDIPITKIYVIINDILNKMKNFQQFNQDNEFSFIREINYSFINSEDKELYEELNELLRKKEYFEEKIRNFRENENVPMSCVVKLFSKVFKCCNKTIKEEYEETKNKLKITLINILKNKENIKNIKKIYITFSSYNIKKFFKNKEILIENKNYILKKTDMYPHDINWENLNLNLKEKILRRIISYCILIIFMLCYFLIILIISKVQGNFQRNYNLSTDCSNIDYENNNNIIYNEYINKNQTEKEKIYTFCYCDSKLNGKKIIYNNINIDPCENYNKYKYQRKTFIFLLSIFLCIIDFFIDDIVGKILSIQKFESKSNEMNLNIIISVIITIFTNIILIVILNIKTKNKYISFFTFGTYEDITPDWLNDIPESFGQNIWTFVFLYGILYIISGFSNTQFLELFKFLLFKKGKITLFYEYFKIRIKELDYQSYSIYMIFCFFIINVLFFIPYLSWSIAVSMAIICLSFYRVKCCQNLKCFHFNRITFIYNKKYFDIIIIFTRIFLIFRYLMSIWWYSSEYFFIDYNKEIYNDFFIKDKNLIDRFLKGKVNILEKIKIKLSLKRNLWFIIPLGLIILLEIIIIIYKIIKKRKEDKEDIIRRINPINVDEYTKIKYYEYYRILYFKTVLYSKNKTYLKELIQFLEYKIKEFGKDILDLHEFDINNEEDHRKMINYKNCIIRNHSVEITNFYYTYSPFLLDEYNISFFSKFILSPYC